MPHKGFNVKRGQIVSLQYESREFEVIVIDPNGLGENQPSIGFGFRMIEKHAGLPEQTLSNWVTEESGIQVDPNTAQKSLKTPSGNTYKLTQMLGLDNKPYYVLEVSEWVSLAADVLKKSGKVRKPTKDKLIEFLTWFATKGLYAEAYVSLKGNYTARDSRSVSNWMLVRNAGKIKRNKYTDFLKEQGCEGYEYANWTNYVYEGLFGKTAKEMKQFWQVIEGTKRIARNYISEEEGLKAVAHCENLAVELFVDDLREAHDDAISNAKRKFDFESKQQ